jgi:Zn-dependent protease with chaperone function
MQIREVNRVVDETVAAMPHPIRAALGEVAFVTAEGPRDRLVLRLVSRLGLPELEVHSDARGLFVGLPPELPYEEDEDDVADIQPPAGIVFLFAGNLADRSEVEIVLCHEVGHALGMDEDEVEALGLV